MGTARDLPKQHPEKKYFGQLWGWFHPCISFCHSNWPAVPFLGFFWFGVWLFACFPLALVVFGFLSCLSCWLLFCLPDYQFTMKPRAVHSLACVFCHDTSISHQFTFPAHGLPVILDIGRSQRRKKKLLRRFFFIHVFLRISWLKGFRPDHLAPKHEPKNEI